MPETDPQHAASGTEPTSLRGAIYRLVRRSEWAEVSPDFFAERNRAAAALGDITRGPVHRVDGGRYYAEVVDGVPLIFRADTAGAVLEIEARR